MARRGETGAGYSVLLVCIVLNVRQDDTINRGCSAMQNHYLKKEV